MTNIKRVTDRAIAGAEAGVSLVEMIIAILVLTVGLVSLAQLFVVATLGNTYAVTTSGGINDAQRLIEAWKIRAATPSLPDSAITSATYNTGTGSCAAFAALTGYDESLSQYKENVWVFDWNGNLVGSASPTYPPGVASGTLRSVSPKSRLIYIRMDPKSPDPRTNQVLELSAMIAGK
jgi:Tfp pilus assembly protein PilV